MKTAKHLIAIATLLVAAQAQATVWFVADADNTEKSCRQSKQPHILAFHLEVMDELKGSMQMTGSGRTSDNKYGWAIYRNKNGTPLAASDSYTLCRELAAMVAKEMQQDQAGRNR